MIDKRKQGKRNRANGAAWERKISEDLERKGWIVSKWHNQVEFGTLTGPNGEFVSSKYKDLILQNGDHWKGCIGRLTKVKLKFNPFTHSMMMISGGFPDFIAYIRVPDSQYYQVVGVECKLGKYLDAEEKEKCRWLLGHGVFSRILVATKIKEGKKSIPDYIDVEDIL